jgi:hypothetical protein
MYFGYIKGPSIGVIHTKWPSGGYATVKLYSESGQLLQTQYINGYSSSTKWQQKQYLSGLDPNKYYYLTITSYNGKPIIVDGFVGYY